MANPSLYAYMLNGKSDFTFVRPLSPNLRVAVSTALAAGVAGGTSHCNQVAHVCHALAVREPEKWTSLASSLFLDFLSLSFSIGN